MITQKRDTTTVLPHPVTGEPTEVPATEYTHDNGSVGVVAKEDRSHSWNFEVARCCRCDCRPGGRWSSFPCGTASA